MPTSESVLLYDLLPVVGRIKTTYCVTGIGLTVAGTTTTRIFIPYTILLFRDPLFRGDGTPRGKMN